MTPINVSDKDQTVVVLIQFAQERYLPCHRRQSLKSIKYSCASSSCVQRNETNVTYDPRGEELYNNGHHKTRDNRLFLCVILMKGRSDLEPPPLIQVPAEWPDSMAVEGRRSKEGGQLQLLAPGYRYVVPTS